MFTQETLQHQATNYELGTILAGRW